MKADKAIRLMKGVKPCSVIFSQTPGALPALTTTAPYNLGWTLDEAVNNAGPIPYQFARLTWSDTIDIAGLSANDLSLINQGGAIARPASPVTFLNNDCTVQQMTLVSVNPIEATSLEMLYANDESVGGNLQDYFLATNQEWQRAADSAYAFNKTGEYNFGTGGIAQATKLYVKSFVWMTVMGAVANTTNILVPPATVAIGAVTAELDSIQMAAAIYRANDQTGQE